MIINKWTSRKIGGINEHWWKASSLFRGAPLPESLERERRTEGRTREKGKLDKLTSIGQMRMG